LIIARFRGGRGKAVKHLQKDFGVIERERKPFQKVKRRTVRRVTSAEKDKKGVHGVKTVKELGRGEGETFRLRANGKLVGTTD